MIQVAIAGIDTGLGQAIATLVRAAPDMLLSGGTSITEHQDSNAPGLTGLLDRSTTLVDVTSPAALMTNAIHCISAGCALVGGVGALDPNHVAELRDFSQRIPIFYAPYLCIETAALLAVLPDLVRRLPHLHAEITGVDQFRRRRNLDDLQQTVEPTVFLTGGEQEILLSQRVYGHSAAARGAMHALRLLAEQPHGFFTMSDLLEQPAVTSGQPLVARVS